MLKSSFVGIAPDLVLPVFIRPQCITHEEYERMNKFLKNTHESLKEFNRMKNAKLITL